ncbi:helix-hairpin-helix domain-containing protein [Denitrificimonas sp. JX-1]|jgi:DNA uptake protein ComE-like DNA-binding protein|uniref:Helix-hairpin-helix domain-containing protein n=1 Tax=Denitrificimonas halotolerans TaxID=3098930 RepID=A0ABU5GQL3_9GAMM|nr:helix-hairpin-helix domain-containing protein [Denitrificimonas sp. JX-1]MDY7218491.1 helix-hairpin-helix domain-containing protein [Denitrificimonas sp. JX-1]
MGFLNIGKKDTLGKQKRIEHRGRHLRVSRTGGIALRKQVKVAGLTVTANTKHGLRVSSRVVKNTRIALQNGRFVLQGRYGSGPTRLNLSKSGVTVSTRNSLGTFNWVKPNRSSVKIAGVQLRGKKAANIQLIYMLLFSLTQSVQMAWHALKYVLQLIITLVIWLFDRVLSIPYGLDVLKQRISHARLKRSFKTARLLFQPEISEWTQPELLTAMQLILLGWGAGITADEAALRLTQHIHLHPGDRLLLSTAVAELADIAQQLEQARDQAEGQTAADPRVIMALLAQQYAGIATEDEAVAGLFAADELVLALGERTVMQDALVQVFADFAGLRLQIADQEIAPRFEVNPRQHFTTESSAQNRSTPALVRNTSALINLNTATLQQLQSLPHIGSERAHALIALRPITQLSQLQSISGIGPARLTAIKAAGVAL